MDKNLMQLLAQFYAFDHRGKFHFYKEFEDTCKWVNASSNHEVDCRAFILEALDRHNNLDDDKKKQILNHPEKDLFWEPDWLL